MKSKRETRLAMSTMLRRRGANNPAPWPLVGAPKINLILFLVFICARAEIVKAQPIDKLSILDQVNKNNSRDNQILKSTSISSDHFWQGRQPFKDHLSKFTDNNNSSNLDSNIVRKLTELAHIRNINKRHRRHSQQLATESSPTTITTADNVKQGRQSDLISSISAPSIPLISTPRVITTLPTVSDSSRNDQATEYATVNYNGVIGVNGTDPYAITTESRSFALPLGIQILMCLFYGTLAFTAITSNMIICYIVLSNQRMRTATNYFIVNLAVGDILMALLCIPFTFPANLIFQSWPFGLSLCVIVSYSQANSVFISAYTMVAISIDKYIAIMHPMRLRMLKNQAKVIILVIWSAALLTSLPTALLSNLTPASPDLTSPQASSTIELAQPVANPTSSVPSVATSTTEANRLHSPQLDSLAVNTGKQATQNSLHEKLQQAPSHQPASRNISKIDVPSTRPTPAPPLSLDTESQQQQDQYEEQKKYFCQESWIFWPRGKYYYSMALMVLQFVVPLFVLIVTYTRIVIVVWGKRMPGEEDNARDARMARSKRKMIKMVIFCVIAFLLTWSPFNALIVIGDIAPEIWEHPNIIYIWFITHYLAMCHTITNPLIYIWMNNRFRTGFKQAIGDLGKFLHQVFAYLFCYCLCFGCCLNCSRQKYARVALEINRKQGRRGMAFASSGSINPCGNNSNHAGGNHQTNLTGGSAAAGSNYQCGTAATSSGCIGGLQTSSTQGGGQAGGGRFVSGSHTPEVNIALCAQNLTGTSLASSPRLDIDSSEDNEVGLHRNREQQQQYMELEPMVGRRQLSSSTTSRELTSTNSDRQHQSGANAAGGGPCKSPNSHSLKCAGGGGGPLVRCRKWCRIRRYHQRSALDSRGQNRGDELAAEQSQPGGHLAAACKATAEAKKKRRRRQTHTVCLQMTTTQFYSPPPPSQRPNGEHTNKCAASPVSGRQNEPASSGCERHFCSELAKLRMGCSLDYPHDCSNCVESSTSLLGSKPPPTLPGDFNYTPPHSRRRSRVRFGQFLVDTRQDSQSTATISAQTNNTSLAISPISSTRGGGGSMSGNDADAAGSGDSPASINDSNNTSASLSASGLAGDLATNHGSEVGVEGSCGDGLPCDGQAARGRTRDCATDDDADDNSINGPAHCEVVNGLHDIEQIEGCGLAGPTSTDTEAATATEPGCSSRGAVCGRGNNFKLTVSANEKRRLSGRASSLSASSSTSSSSSFKGGSLQLTIRPTSAIGCHQDSCPSRALLHLSLPANGGGVANAAATAHGLRHSPGILINESKPTPNKIDAVRTRDLLLATKLSGATQLENNDAVRQAQRKDGADRAAKLLRHTEQLPPPSPAGIERHRKRGRASNKSKCWRRAVIRFSHDHRQTASAIEVNQLSESPTETVKGRDHLQANYLLGLSDQCDDLTGEIRLDSNGKRSKSTLELMSTRWLGGQRKSYELLNYNLGQPTTRHHNQDSDSDQPLSCRSASDLDHATSENELEEEEDDDGQGGDSTGNGSDCVRFMLTPISSVESGHPHQ